MATEWIDISVPIYAGMVHWPGDPPVEISQPLHLDRGDVCTVSRLALGIHTGTHIDAPNHFLRGAKSVDSLSPDAMMGPARVIEILETTSIGEAELSGRGIERGDRILLKTSNSTPYRSVRRLQLAVTGARTDNHEQFRQQAVVDRRDVGEPRRIDAM